MTVNGNIAIENAHIMFRNFRGEASKFNAAGKRNFCVRLDQDIADQMIHDGWNVKFLRPLEEGDEPTPYIQVAVSFDNIEPNIFTITDHHKNRLNGDTIDILDYAEIENIDLIIRPYNWEVNGKTGVKAYVKNMYVTLVEDEFADKYADISDED